MNEPMVPLCYACRHELRHCAPGGAFEPYNVCPNCGRLFSDAVLKTLDWVPETVPGTAFKR